jgi:predicted dehydrogenase
MSRIAVLGLTHDHVWDVLQQLRESRKGVLVAAADPHPPLLDRAREQYGCAVFPDAAALLEHESLDAVLVYADNAAGVRLTEQAAARGLHILVEKPMAANLAGADRMIAAVRRAGVRLMVNWPFAWWPQLQHALRLARGGELGHIWQVKYRAAHAGPREFGCSPFFCDWLYDRQRNGGGALMDYCCYGAALARCLLGVPARVSAVAGRFVKEDIPVEDNAVLVMTYPRGLAVAEGSWTQIGTLTAYLTAIYGTRGTLLVEPRSGGRLLRADAENPAGIPVEVPPSPAEFRSAPACFLHCLETGTPFPELCQDRTGRDAQEILEAGLLAMARGAEVSLPLNDLRSGGALP